MNVFITNKTINNKILEDINNIPDIRSVFIVKIKRGFISTKIPIVARIKLHCGDIITLTGLTKDIKRVIKFIDETDRSTNSSDVTFLSAVIAIDALIRTIMLKVDTVLLILSTAKGSLITGFVFG